MFNKTFLDFQLGFYQIIKKSTVCTKMADIMPATICISQAGSLCPMSEFLKAIYHLSITFLLLKLLCCIPWPASRSEI